MKKKFAVSVVVCLVVLCALVLTTQSAFAHEKRHVGKYTFVIGFLDEPAYANIKNGLDLTICNGDACTYTTQDGQKVVANAVENAEQALKAEVLQGGAQPLALSLEPRWANPGKYAGYFLPTTAGAYTFHIYGTLSGQKIDEKFTSSPNGFSEVQQIIAYPATTKNVSASADTSALSQQIKDTQNSAQTAATLGIVGIVIGVVGVALAAFAFTRRSRIGQEAKESAESLRG
ncbi:hypothetical protein KSD_31370 [Ktedonobacter sp. SOSP1-85]|uniref:hypothetical protein n=1 Tax=Ktedonobacter sp. SOSP1-85 TaxID=2778367 RepID=UPI00191612E7|nr:hypothetical protein [Ktedonobacter sp. SOSP1-85]GHO75366.1 hypothetical protein KSD_31370 [Ktedonobacter sp. SOSP1-85]